jgi:isochorismate hydrolase
MYASDCDLKMRLEGIPTAQLDILCWHYGGASHRLAVGGQPYEQADKDRAYFDKKWGHGIDSEQYAEKIRNLG